MKPKIFDLSTGTLIDPPRHFDDDVQLIHTAQLTGVRKSVATFLRAIHPWRWLSELRGFGNGGRPVTCSFHYPHGRLRRRCAPAQRLRPEPVSRHATRCTDSNGRRRTARRCGRSTSTSTLRRPPDVRHLALPFDFPLRLSYRAFRRRFAVYGCCANPELARTKGWHAHASGSVTLRLGCTAIRTRPTQLASFDFPTRST